MRRRAISLAVIATLLAPIQALASMGIGCDDVRATSACCCPTSRDSSERERDAPSSIDRTCCCDVQPASPTAPQSPSALAPSSVAVDDAATRVGAETPSPSQEGDAAPSASARGPPPPAASLYEQHIALLL